MKSFIRVAAYSPEIKVANTVYNSEIISQYIEKAKQSGVQLAVFPELCITGASCGDLFLEKKLISDAFSSLLKISEHTDNTICAVVGLPFSFKGGLYNCAGLLFDGKILGVVPKSFTSADTISSESRYFSDFPDTEYSQLIQKEGIEFSFGKILFNFSDLFTLGIEIGDEFSKTVQSDLSPVNKNAQIIANLGCEPETVTSFERRKDIIKLKSSFGLCTYIYAGASIGESTTDAVYGGADFIAENGKIIANSHPFETQGVITETDIDIIKRERIKNNISEYCAVNFDADILNVPIRSSKKSSLIREFPQFPFIPSDKAERDARCKSALEIQSAGLVKRLSHIHASKTVIGISGGLDSTLALLVTVRAYQILSLPLSDILCVTMPCFGTTERTKSNAVKLCEAVGVTVKEIDITGSVKKHFEDIGHDINIQNAAYENSQARERTQILMDIANDIGGIVIGTGDLSELALGWATYNGDHMSMYAVNSSVPKTMVRCIVEYCSKTSENSEISRILKDILNTPVSPELLPPKDGVISQCTEKLVGPYELNDFFIYYFIKYGYTPEKLFFCAAKAFEGKYSKDEIIFRLKSFIRRFFSQQFKRSCMPDGPAIGSISFSPRAGFKMPSDACADLWYEEAEKIEKELTHF